MCGAGRCGGTRGAEVQQGLAEGAGPATLMPGLHRQTQRSIAVRVPERARKERSRRPTRGSAGRVMGSACSFLLSPLATIRWTVPAGFQHFIYLAAFNVLSNQNTQRNRASPCSSDTTFLAGAAACSCTHTTQTPTHSNTHTHTPGEVANATAPAHAAATPDPWQAQQRAAGGRACTPATPGPAAASAQQLRLAPAAFAPAGTPGAAPAAAHGYTSSGTEAEAIH
eukprot:scaffold40235_cov17-Tisochrysis_lutea.AAC.1